MIGQHRVGLATAGKLSFTVEAGWDAMDLRDRRWDPALAGLADQGRADDASREVLPSANSGAH